MACPITYPGECLAGREGEPAPGDPKTAAQARRQAQDQGRSGPPAKRDGPRDAHPNGEGRGRRAEGSLSAPATI